MSEKAVMIVNVPSKGIREDLEIPLNISANDLILAFSGLYGFPVNPDNIFSYYLKADNPKALLRGEKMLSEYGLRTGTELWTWNV